MYVCMQVSATVKLQSGSDYCLDLELAHSIRTKQCRTKVLSTKVRGLEEESVQLHFFAERNFFWWNDESKLIQIKDMIKRYASRKYGCYWTRHGILRCSLLFHCNRTQHWIQCIAFKWKEEIVDKVIIYVVASWLEVNSSLKQSLAAAGCLSFQVLTSAVQTPAGSEVSPPLLNAYSQSRLVASRSARHFRKLWPLCLCLLLWIASAVWSICVQLLALLLHAVTFSDFRVGSRGCLCSLIEMRQH